MVKLEPIGQGVALLLLATALYRFVTGVYYPALYVPMYEPHTCTVENFWLYTGGGGGVNGGDAGQQAAVVSAGGGGGGGAGAGGGGEHGEVIGGGGGHGKGVSGDEEVRRWLRRQLAAGNDFYGRGDGDGGGGVEDDGRDTTLDFFVMTVSFERVGADGVRHWASVLLPTDTRRLRNCTDVTACSHELERRLPGFFVTRGATLECYAYEAYFMFAEQPYAGDYDGMLVSIASDADEDAYVATPSIRQYSGGGANDGGASVGGGSDDGSSGTEPRQLPLRVLLESEQKVFLERPVLLHRFQRGDGSGDGDDDDGKHADLSGGKPVGMGWRRSGEAASYKMLSTLIRDETAAAQTSSDRMHVLLWYSVVLCMVCVPCFGLSGLFLVAVGCLDVRIRASLQRLLAASGRDGGKDHVI